MIRLAILGSTGSIGESTLRVVERHPGRFQVVGLAANRSLAALREQVERHKPRHAVLADPGLLGSIANGGPTRWACGRDEVLALAAADGVDVVVNAMVGSAGLEPTLRALEAGKRVALANKESLVAGGSLVLAAARRGGGELIPVDSEHSAILQCMEGYARSGVHRVVLTASGGPFRGRSREELLEVGPDEALRHPTWEMGSKITVDSATLANKALEVIEAHFLYGVSYERIDVVVHPQSIVHSFVEFVDGSVLGQVGFPTMELPILYALAYPERIGDPELRTFDPVGFSPLTFEEVDVDAFPLFALGLEAGRRGGTAPAVYNAANEVAVEAFLQGKVGFIAMAEVVSEALERHLLSEIDVVEDVIEADRQARQIASAVVHALDGKVGGRQG